MHAHRHGITGMGYQDRDEELAGRAHEPLSWATLALSSLVRIVGVVVLFVGLWAGVKIIVEAWTLYEQPQRIVRFADAIQAGSNLDGLIGNLGSGGEGDEAAPAPAARPASGGALRLSYFAAWFIALLLMFVIGSLAMAAITTGGQLALYDMQIKRHAREVIREVRRLRRAA